MKCRAVPYNGENPYIFFSYCHADAEAAYPIIEKMRSDGYRVWYDDGIHPGSSWPDHIAARLDGSAACIALISVASSQSHNCRNEINLALERKKPLLGVLLEDFEMPLGMRLQLGTIQYIKKYELESEAALYPRLYSAEPLAPCLKGPDDAEDEQTPAPEMDEEATVRQSTESPLAVVRLTGEEAWLLDSSLVRLGSSSQKCDIAVPGGAALSECHADLIQHNDRLYLRDAGAEGGTWAENDRLEANGRAELKSPAYFRLGGERFQVAGGKLAKWLRQQGRVLVLRNAVTGEQMAVMRPTLLLGRSYRWPEGTLSNPSVGRIHARLTHENGVTYVEDMNSANGLFLNGRELELEEKAPLKNGDLLHLGDTDLECRFVELKM